MTKQSMLFLDDEMWRHDGARKHFGKRFEMWHAFDMMAFRKWYDKRDFDVVSLDHDLGWTMGCGTGMQAVDYIIELPEERRPKLVIVHSWNVVEAPRMTARLLAAGLKTVEKRFSYPP